MANLQREIAYRRRQISTHQADLASLYGDLGRLGLASGQGDRSLASREQRLRYAQALEAWQKAAHSCQQIAGYIRQIEDRSRQVGAIEADIKALAVEEERLYSRLGAMAWEAYGFDTLPMQSRQICTPIFASHAKRIATLTARIPQKGGSLVRRLALGRLGRLRRHLAPLLATAGRALVEAGLEEELDLSRAEDLRLELKSVQVRRTELGEELAIHRSAIAELKSEEGSSPKTKLEESEALASQLKSDYEAEEKAYGALLFEAGVVGISEEWDGLVTQIRLHSNRILSLEEEIHTLGNKIKAEELSAQIEVEQRRIAHLRASMESAHRQIIQLDASIADKRHRIDELLGSEHGRIDD